jgi:hypothetical protein
MLWKDPKATSKRKIIFPPGSFSGPSSALSSMPYLRYQSVFVKVGVILFSVFINIDLTAVTTRRIMNTRGGDMIIFA